MRLVAATRILNEDDIVEAFIRHNATHIDHFLLLDDGSQDGTLDILARLKAEGFAITVFQQNSASFEEVSANTWLYHYAAQTLSADWVCFLDSDEFLTTDDLNYAADADRSASLKDRLSQLGPAFDCLRLRLVNYVQSPDDDMAVTLVPHRLRWRHRVPHDVHKVFVRSNPHDPRVVIGGGNHTAEIDDAHLPCQDESWWLLAHYPRRSVWHEIGKSVSGWLKALAAGTRETQFNRSIHYQPVFQWMRDDPAGLLFNEAYIVPPINTETQALHPLNYAGSALRYTTWQDPRMRAVQIMARFTETLARRHGRLLDDVPGAFEATQKWNTAQHQVM